MTSPKQAMSQARKILTALIAGERITPLAALRRFNCLRLSGRILDLRKLGHRRIKTKMVKVGRKRVAQYFYEGRT